MNTIFFYWDVRSDKDKEYQNFIFSEYLPAMSRMGITVIDGWLKMVGDGPQIIAVGEGANYDQVNTALNSREFKAIETRLFKYVENYSKHITRKSTGKKNSRDTLAE